MSNLKKFIFAIMMLQIIFIGLGVWSLIKGDTSHGILQIVLNFVCGLFNLYNYRRL